MGPIGTPPPPQGDSHRITTLLARKASKDWGWGRSRSYQAVPQAHQLCTPGPSGPSVESLTPPWSADPCPHHIPRSCPSLFSHCFRGKGLETPDEGLKT